MIGKNLESACRAWHHQEALRLTRQVNKAASKALLLTRGTPQWQAAVDEFIRLDRARQEHQNGDPR